MLPGLTEEQNEYLEALHIKALDDALELYKKYRETSNYGYFEMGEVKFAKARAYYELGNFNVHLDVRR